MSIHESIVFGYLDDIIIQKLKLQKSNLVNFGNSKKFP